jgi:4-hydroxybenzoate polyprenyltransferase
MPYNKIAVFIASMGLPFIAWLRYPSLTQEMLKDLRIPRILHYVALAGMGISLALRNLEAVKIFFLNGGGLSLIVLILSLVYAAVFAIVSNNIEDLPTDKLTNPSRPLVLGTVNPQHYLWVGIFCQIWAFLLASSLSMGVFGGIFGISFGYYLYSCSPFRLKKIPILAKFILGFNSLAVALCGWMLCGKNAFDFPLKWTLFILIPLSLAANFVDLKDTEGDKLMNVRTLPVLLGQEKAIHLIAGFTLFSYFVAGLLLENSWLFIPNVFIAFLHIRFLYKKPYNEKPIFLIFVSALYGLDVFLLL